MSKKLIPLDNVRVKYRTDERNGRRIATVTIWMDDKPLQEIATLDLELIERPGDPHYQGWVDLVSAAFHGWLSRRTGLEGITGKRQAPRYKGE